MLMAQNASNVGGTMLGFLRHEPLGMILMVPFFICFLGANKNLNRDRIIETVICKKLQVEYMQY